MLYTYGRTKSKTQFPTRDENIRNLPGTYLPQILKYGNKDQGIVYIQISMTMNIAFGIVSLPSSGLAMTLYLLNRINRQHITNSTETKKNSHFLWNTKNVVLFFCFHNMRTCRIQYKHLLLLHQCPIASPWEQIFDNRPIQVHSHDWTNYKWISAFSTSSQNHIVPNLSQTHWTVYEVVLIYSRNDLLREIMIYRWV